MTETTMNGSMETNDVVAALAAYGRAADHRDVPALEELLAGDFRLVFAVGGGAPRTVPRPAYFDLVRAGKTGGADRTVELVAVQDGGGFATASARLRRPDAAFEGLYTFVHEDGRWRLLQEAVRMTPVAS